MTIKVIYHANCIDGLFAAIAFNDNMRDGVRYLARTHYDIKDVVKHKDIMEYDQYIFADICPNKETILQLLEMGVGVTVIDHHQTALETISEMPQDINQLYLGKFRFVYSNCESGASLIRILDVNLLRNINTSDIGEVRTIYPTDNDDFYLTNISNHLFMPNNQLYAIGSLWDMIRIRDNFDTESELFNEANWTHAYLRYLVNELDGNLFKIHKTIYRDFGSTPYQSERGFVEHALNIGKYLHENSISAVKAAIKGGLTRTVTTASGEKITVVVGMPPYGEMTMFGYQARLEHPDVKLIAVGMYYNMTRSYLSYGIRSNNVECLTLAKHYGGGGHFNATTAIIQTHPCREDTFTGSDYDGHTKYNLLTQTHGIINKIQELY